MKKLTLIALLLLSAFTSVKAIGIKLYVGSVEKAGETNIPAYLQLVVCNNTLDTIYIPKQQLELMQPAIINDVTELTEGGSYIMLANTPTLINDMDALHKIAPTPDKLPKLDIRALDKPRQDANNQLVHQKVNELDCFVFAPNQCLTINCLMMTFPLEYYKLHDVKPAETQHMEANLVMSAEYFSKRNMNGKDILLISRSSDELKEHLLNAGKKK